jgi:two-component system response regulator AlgR
MRILITDDEPLARNRLRSLVSEIPGMEVVGEAASGREAVELTAALRPDALLLDIQMPGMDGLEAARHVAQLEQPPAVVFCTAYDEHALAAFEARAVDYLVKPIRRERLHEALERARRLSGENLNDLQADFPNARVRTHLCARLRGNMRLIALDEVRFLQAEEKYVVVHHARGEDLIEESLKALEVEFAGRFVRIHRNCLVARAELQELRRTPDGHYLAVLRHDEHQLEVSRRCLSQLRTLVSHL